MNAGRRASWLAVAASAAASVVLLAGTANAVTQGSLARAAGQASLSRVAAAQSRAARSQAARSQAAQSRAAVPQVRVNQEGYAPGGPKLAFAMLPRRVGAVAFTIASGHRVVFRGRSTELAGGWNTRYRAVYQLGFTGLSRPGTYRITIHAAGATAVSPAFRVAAPGALYPRLVRNSVRYFTSERDGADVVHSVLSRRPANLTDRRAQVYAPPRFDGDDNLLGAFRRISGGPVDVGGGWFDAGGGYEKFAYTGSYSDGLLLLAARDTGGTYPTLAPEARFGLRWLQKLWRPARKVLYMQVGVGTGNASSTIQGDYNFWYLPQAEDHLDLRPGHQPGPSGRFVKYRPVFEAARPGAKIDPDFAGRFAADFALGAQLDARTAGSAGPQARHQLALARSVFATAKTQHVGALLTTYPHDFYPATQWKSDLLWGAAEIALADEALGAPVAQLQADLAVAARWARAYLGPANASGRDTLNLYDPGAVGEAELLRALTAAPAGSVNVGPAITPQVLLAGLAAQLKLGEHRAHGDPFGLGTQLGASDAVPHAFGLYVTEALYRHYGGSDAYRSFAQQQLNFALGANAWGSSFVVGAGKVFPHCMQSEIANLAGSLTGRGRLQLGAVTDGPSNPANFVGLGTVDGMRACSAGHFAPFTTKTARYEDNVVSWPSVEPADDYTAVSLLAFALAAKDGQ
ncbi:MAG: glycoside hydrolase family 9 protein [Actinomycetota bacterium]